MNDESDVGTSELPSHLCWELLRSARVGRLAFAGVDGPEIFPVNFVVDHGTLVVRSAPGTKLIAARERAAVAFEIDGYEPDVGDAWSVIIKGRAEEITDLYESIDAVSLPLFPWQHDPKHHLIRVVPVDVTGRRFRTVDDSHSAPVRRDGD